MSVNDVRAENPVDDRTRALKRLEAKASFRTHVFAYVAVNALLVVLWALTTPGAFFWPVFPILGWGIGVAFHAWSVSHYAAPFSEEQINAEMRRIRG